MVRIALLLLLALALMAAGIWSHLTRREPPPAAPEQWEVFWCGVAPPGEHDPWGWLWWVLLPALACTVVWLWGVPS